MTVHGGDGSERLGGERSRSATYRWFSSGGHGRRRTFHRLVARKVKASAHSPLPQPPGRITTPSTQALRSQTHSGIYTRDHTRVIIFDTRVRAGHDSP